MHQVSAFTNAISNTEHRITFVNTFRFITEHSFQTLANSVHFTGHFFFESILPVFSGCIKVIEVLWRLSVPSGVPFQHRDCVSGDFSISCYSVSIPLSRDHRALDDVVSLLCLGWEHNTMSPGWRGWAVGWRRVSEYRFWLWPCGLSGEDPRLVR